MYIPNSSELRKTIWKEVHIAPYSGHPGVTKMLADIKPLYFWKGMKKDAARIVAGCFECQNVNVEHQHPAGLLQPHSVPNWKWQIISMDFVQDLLMTSRHNAILVVVDRLTKVAHFILGNLTDGTSVIARKFVQEIFRLHGVLEKIISDRDARMTYRFWQTLFSALGIQLNISIAYHPCKCKQIFNQIGRLRNL